MSNRSAGNAFETEFCEILAENGFWAHNLAQRAEGQPADVIAAKKGVAFLIDCKVCEKDVFRLDRMEQNQVSAMSHWESCGNYGAYFAVKLQTTGEIFMLRFDLLKRMSQKSLKRKDMIMFPTLSEWMRARKR